jgi:hypothetical protein
MPFSFRKGKAGGIIKPIRVKVTCKFDDYIDSIQNDESCYSITACIETKEKAMSNSKLHDELVELFGEEPVKLALMQEILAQRYTMKNPDKVKRSLDRFSKLKNLKQQKEFVAAFDKDLARAFICSLLCNTASKAIVELASQAIDDKRRNRPVLGGNIIQRKF